MEQQQRDELIKGIFENTQTIKRGMFTRLHQAAEQLPVTRAHLELLFTLDHHQPVSAKELASAMQLTPGAISQMVDKLLQHELVSRLPSQHDRRIQLLELTDKARAMMKKLEAQRHLAMENVMRSLSTEELELWLQVQRKLMSEFSSTTTTNPLTVRKEA